MGILRFLLAITVVLAHTSPLFGIEMVGPVIAVKAFYIISGFYMAFILNEKYKEENGSYWFFIKNRLLRIYPVYWAVLGCSIIIFLAIHYLPFQIQKVAMIESNSRHLSFSHIVSLFLVNVLIVGQDVMMFLKLNGDFFSFTSDFKTSKPPLYFFLLIPQAWSIALELYFYLLAPFLSRTKSLFIVLLILTGIVLRIYLVQIGLSNDPWNYRFFPTEIVFFCLGVLSYKVFKNYKEYFYKRVKITHSISIVLLLFTVSFQVVPRDYMLSEAFYYGLVIVGIPCLFVVTKKYTIDRFIGELSFPIYISHMLVIYALNLFSKSKALVYNPNANVLIVCGLTIIFSMMLVKFIIKPIELIRQERFTKAINTP